MRYRLFALLLLAVWLPPAAAQDHRPPDPAKTKLDEELNIIINGPPAEPFTFPPRPPFSPAAQKDTPLPDRSLQLREAEASDVIDFDDPNCMALPPPEYEKSTWLPYAGLILAVVGVGVLVLTRRSTV